MRRILLGLAVGLLALASGVAGAPPARDITFVKDAAPILFEKCVYCHRPGEIGPFSMLTYDSVRPWARSIKQEVASGRMPPWPADPRFGKFHDSKRLSEKEIQTLIAWVDGGAKQGAAEATPAPPQFAEGWQIGTPDLVVTMTAPHTVPASGVVPYLTFPTDYVFPEDTWVQAIEVRPGNRAVVHHAFALLGSDAPNATGLHLYSPGLEALIFREGYGRMIPKGSRIHVQMHYNPTGREEVDQTSVGFKIARKPVHTTVFTEMLVNTAIAIPPLTRSHEVIAAVQFPFEARIHALRPHMHLRGKDATVTLIQPDGSRRILLHIPAWNDRWQYYYVLEKPETVPKGAIIEYVVHYDNSPDNRLNPDPRATVGYGDQLFDEMHLLYINWTEVTRDNRRDREPIQIAPRSINH